MAPQARHRAVKAALMIQPATFAAGSSLQHPTEQGARVRQHPSQGLSLLQRPQVLLYWSPFTWHKSQPPCTALKLVKHATPALAPCAQMSAR